MVYVSIFWDNVIHMYMLDVSILGQLTYMVVYCIWHIVSIYYGTTLYIMYMLDVSFLGQLTYPVVHEEDGDEGEEDGEPPAHQHQYVGPDLEAEFLDVQLVLKKDFKLINMLKITGEKLFF